MATSPRSIHRRVQPTCAKLQNRKNEASTDDHCIAERTCRVREERVDSVDGRSGSHPADCLHQRGEPADRAHCRSGRRGAFHTVRDGRKPCTPLASIVDRMHAAFPRCDIRRGPRSALDHVNRRKTSAGASGLTGLLDSRWPGARFRCRRVDTQRAAFWCVAVPLRRSRQHARSARLQRSTGFTT